MIKTCVIGASGYTGAELASLLNQHPNFNLSALYVSANSQDKGRALGDIHGALFGKIPLCMQALDETMLVGLAQDMDLIFLATPHEASHDWMSKLCGHKAVIMDLSGAFRIKNQDVFKQYYGFSHQHETLLQHAVYGLADWHGDAIAKADIVAVPGCYPTAALTALKPLQNNDLISADCLPIINAVSGVTGAGRKAALASCFSEVSLQAYGVLGHRHQPEIAQYLGKEVIFTPHLGNFKRGILATITVKLTPDANADKIDKAYQQAYANNSIVRLRDSWPKVDDVVHSPYCDLYHKFDPKSGYLVVGSAIDNLLKGAASQALQCANLRFGFSHHLGLC